jgi:hypothetical protein
LMKRKFRCRTKYQSHQNIKTIAARARAGEKEPKGEATLLLVVAAAWVADTVTDTPGVVAALTPWLLVVETTVTVPG